MPSLRSRCTRLAASALPLLVISCSAASGPATTAAPEPAVPPAAGPAAGSTSRSAGIPAGVLVVANQQSASASVIELPSGESTEIPVGEGPHEAAISPDGRLAAVTVYGTQTPGNQLAVIDLRTKTLVRTIDLGEYRRPHGVVALPGSPELVAVTSEAARHLLIVDIVAGAVVTAIPTEARGSHMVALTADGRRAFTANIPDGTVTELDLTANDLVRVSPVATMTEGIAVTPDGREVWVGSNDAGTVSVLDTGRDEVVATITGMEMPYRLGISADGALAVVPDPKANAVYLIDVKSRTVTGSITGLASPRGVSISPDGRTAFVTLGEGSAVAVVDVASRGVITTIPVGISPDGVAFAPRER